MCVCVCVCTQGYDPATYAVLESRLSNIVKEHLERHLSGGSTHDADCFNGPLPAQSPVGYTTNHNTSRVRSPPTHTLSLDSMLTGQGLPQHLHHLHVAAPAVPSPVRVSAPARGSEDAEGGDWGSVHGSGGSTKFTPAARAAFEENAAQAREARSSLPGNACMLPVVGVEPPSLQVFEMHAHTHTHAHIHTHTNIEQHLTAGYCQRCGPFFSLCSSE